MTPLIWLILLLAAGVALIVLELFIPSGGILSVLSVAAVAAAIALAYFYYGAVVGTVFFGVAVVVMPVVLVLALRWWPNTPLGRRILIKPPASEEELFSEDDPARALMDLVGKRGQAKSPLLPSGAVLIEGRTYDAVSEGTSIEAGQAIEVIEATGNHIIVRGLKIAADDEKSDSADILSRPIDALGLDALDDPLA